MLHEILLALLGHTGSIIIEMEEGFLVNPVLEFLSTAEVDIINRIVQIGFLYKQISKFQDRYGGISTKLALQLAYEEQKEHEEANKNQDEDLSKKEEDIEEEGMDVLGVYIKAFCSGVNEIL